jgi:hypothetical protein
MADTTATTETQAGAATGTASGATVVFTPEQQKIIDAMAGNIRKESTAKGEAAGVEALLKSMGFANPEELTVAMAEFKKVTDAQKSEQQKALEQNAVLEKKLSEATEREKASKALADERLLRSAVMVEAGKLGFTDPEDAWTFVDKSKLSIDGEKVKGVDAAVAEVLKSKAYLKAGTSKPPPNINAGGEHQTDPLAGREKEIATRFRLPIRSKPNG